MTMSDRDLAQALVHVSTATAASLLLRKGISQVAMQGIRPVVLPSGGRIAGRAQTIRYLPVRGDKPANGAEQRQFYIDVFDRLRAGEILMATHDSGRR